MKPQSRTTFLRKATAAHGSYYDYSKVTYERFDSAVTIVCPNHGEFKQQPVNHYRGKGCAKCGEARRIAVVSKTTEAFIVDAKVIHGDLYDYSKTKYVNNRKLLEIVCPKHGSFWQSPEKHLFWKQGCKPCGRYRSKEDRTLTTKQFIANARKVHGLRYDYSKVNYITGKTKVEIVCRKHGSFWQLPSNHTGIKNGCPTCGANHISQASQKWLDGLGVKKREWKIPGTNYKCDGYDPATNTVYEYLGKFWHGCPKTYDPDSLNARTGTTFRSLYENTQKRLALIESLGYKLVTLWER